jgi:hypothetical protein
MALGWARRGCVPRGRERCSGEGGRCRSEKEPRMPAKLSVLGLVGEALRDVFGNLAGLVRIA